MLQRAHWKKKSCASSFKFSQSLLSLTVLKVVILSSRFNALNLAFFVDELSVKYDPAEEIKIAPNMTEQLKMSPKTYIYYMCCHFTLSVSAQLFSVSIF